MLNLVGQLDNNTIKIINDMVKIKFCNASIFKTPESVVLFEQNFLPRDKLLELCNQQYTETLQEPKGGFIPSNIINVFRNTNLVPIQFHSNTKTIDVLYVPEYAYTYVTLPGYTIVRVPTTLHHYISQFIRLYGNFRELLPISGKNALDMILNEAIRLHVPDLTISNEEECVIVYYNYKKQKMMSNNIFPKYIMGEIIKVLTISTPIADESDNKAKYVGYDIDDEYRARVVINKNYFGNVITIRLFPNSAFNNTYEDLNINEELIEFLRNEEIQDKNGLRIIVGETMSGKNTTALAYLQEIVNKGTKKVVSIEMPVEQCIHGVEQINCEFIEEYSSNIESLIHQNPDFVYIAETKDETGMSVMKIANTGKRVLTTLHSNSVADTISRIVDITGLSSNRIIQVLHSIIHQRLVRIGDNIYPENKFVYFDDEFKEDLYDKSFGYIIKEIKSKERGGFNNRILSSE